MSTSRRPRHRSAPGRRALGARTIAVIVAMLPLLLASATTAQRGTASIEPRVGRAAITVLLDALPMDRDQRLIADLLYRDYVVALDELSRRAAARAEAAGRRRVEDAFAGRVVVGAEELRRLRVTVLETSRASGAEADALLHHLVEDLRTLVPDDACETFDLALADLRRATWLDPRRAGSGDESYAGDGVDVVLLAGKAMAPDGELAAADHTAIDEALKAYRVEIGDLLTESATADRDGRLDLAVARIERNTEDGRRAEQAALARWRRLDALNRRAVGRVATIAHESAGQSAAQRWLDRFDRSCFPWLFGPARPTRQYEWIARQPLDDESQAQAARIHAEYVNERTRLCREAMMLLLRGRGEHQVRFHARMDPSILTDGRSRALYEDLLKNSGQRARLETETSEALSRLLTERQRQQMRADLAAAGFGRRR